jgi:hypothetical protein
MATALTLIVILVACAALIVWAFITGRVSAARRRTYLPPTAKPSPGSPVSDDAGTPPNSDPAA